MTENILSTLIEGNKSKYKLSDENTEPQGRKQKLKGPDVVRR